MINPTQTAQEILKDYTKYPQDDFIITSALAYKSAWTNEKEFLDLVNKTTNKNTFWKHPYALVCERISELTNAIKLLEGIK
jgi:hypothetical protein